MPMTTRATLRSWTAAVMSASAIAVCAAEPAWTSAGILNVARGNHTATLLPDGKVLVAGGLGKPRVSNNGQSIPNRLGSAELYDPATDSWKLTGSLAVPRYNHTATLLAAGRVLVAGGTTTDGGTSVVGEIYDALTGAWSSVEAQAFARLGHTATLLLDGRVLFAAGADAVTPDLYLESWEYRFAYADIFDPATARSEPAAPLALARYGPSATRLLDGRVLVIGGFDANEFYVARPEIYAPATNTWTAAPDTLLLFGHSAVLLRDGRVLVAGGQSSWLFDPGTGQWTFSRPATWVYGNTATLLSDGDVLLVGGARQVNGRGTTAIADTVERFDPRAGTWREVGTLRTGRTGHSTTLLRDGRVLTAGGMTSYFAAESVLDSSELYVPSSAGGIDAGYTGAWFDPAQSGHGLFIEMLPGSRLLVAWFSFDTAGEQAWFLGVGTYSGRSATIAAVEQPLGGRWIPNFDPARITRNPWGTLTLTFSDCNHGRVEFASAAGFGSGGMNLTRLTRPLGVACP